MTVSSVMISKPYVSLLQHTDYYRYHLSRRLTKYLPYFIPLYLPTGDMPTYKPKATSGVVY